MNQILSVQNDNNDNNNSSYNSGNYNNSGKYKGTKKVEIKAVIVFFCIILIAFGVFIIGNGIVSMSNKPTEISEENNTEGSEIKEAQISVQVISETEISLIITHNKAIENVEYSWNDEEVTKQDGNGNKNVEISHIEIPPNENELKAIVTDIDGNQTIFNKSYTSPDRPLIKLSSEANAIKVQIQSEKVISTVTYYWDANEPKTYNINAPKTSTTLEVKDEGEHTLHISATDKEGNTATKTKKIKVVKAPEIKVTTDGQNFIIRASDDEEISKIIVNLNGTESEKEVNQKQYEEKIKLIDGENRIIVTVINSNGIKKQARLKWTKE